MFGGHHHPWRALRALTGWTLKWESLPVGMLGDTNFAEKTITLDPVQNKTQAQRRCTADHEVRHARRGPFPAAMEAREELLIDKASAREMIDIYELAEVLAWATTREEAAEDLWVDVDTLIIRLKYLHPAERAYLRQRLEEEERPPDD